MNQVGYTGLGELIEKYGSELRQHAVEVSVNGTSGKYFLPDDSILRNQTIVGLAIQPPEYDQENSVYFTQNSPLTNAAKVGADGFYNAYITLKNNNIEVIDSQPLKSYAITEENKDLQQLFIPRLTPSKSFIQVGAPGTAGRLAAGEVFLLHFYYLANQ